MKPPGKGSLLVIFLTVFIDLLGFGMVLPLLPIYSLHIAEQRGWREGEWQIGLVIGLLMSSFSLMQFLFAPLWGRLSDRIGRRPVLMVGLAGSVVFYTLFGLATVLQSLTLLFVSRIGAGIAGATISTASAYIADVTTLGNRTKGMALIGAAFGLGFTFGPLFGFLAVPDGKGDPGPGPGYAAAALSAVALLVAIFKLPESLTPGHAAQAEHGFTFSALRNALRVPSVGLVLLASFVCVFAFANFEPTLSVTLEDPTGPFRYDFKGVCLTFAFIGFVLLVEAQLLAARYQLLQVVVGGLGLLALAGTASLVHRGAHRTYAAVLRVMIPGGSPGPASALFFVLTAWLLPAWLLLLPGLVVPTANPSHLGVALTALAVVWVTVGRWGPFRRPAYQAALYVAGYVMSVMGPAVAAPEYLPRIATLAVVVLLYTGSAIEGRDSRWLTPVAVLLPVLLWQALEPLPIFEWAYGLALVVLAAKYLVVGVVLHHGSLRALGRPVTGHVSAWAQPFFAVGAILACGGLFRLAFQTRDLMALGYGLGCLYFVGSALVFRQPAFGALAVVTGIVTYLSALTLTPLPPGWYGVGSAVAKFLDGDGGSRAELLRRMNRDWPFFRAILSNLDMVLAKTERDIARAYADLAPDRLEAERIFALIEAEWDRASRALEIITGARERLVDNASLARSIRHRFPYISPLNYLQVELIRRWRSGAMRPRRRPSPIKCAASMSRRRIRNSPRCTRRCARSACSSRSPNCCPR